MYNLELDRLIKEINQRKAKQVLVQLPDGLKKDANKIVDEVEKNTQAKAFLWLSDCFGACDIPLGLDILKIDLMIGYGHNRYWKEKEW